MAMFGSSNKRAGIAPGEDDWFRRMREQEALQALRSQGDINGGLVPAMAPGGPLSGLLGSTSRLANAPRLTHEPSPGSPAPMSGGDEPSPFRPMLPDFSQENMRNQLPDMTNAPRTQPGQSQQLDPRLAAIVGQAPVKRNNTGRDILASVLAVMGDTLSPDQRGPGAVDRLAKVWGKRRETYDEKLQNYETRKRLASMPGMTERELQAFALDPKAWAGSMAGNATSRFGAATLNPGDTRYLGDDNGTYQAPTRGQQYAKALGAVEGSDQWNEALRDQELGANGPTAFGNQKSLQAVKDAQAVAMEKMRQQGRMTMQGARVAGQRTVRGTPTYRDLNPPMRPPRASKVPTATGANGETIFYKGGKWVDAQGRPVG